jgi:trans-aconitate methyltransferase
LNEKIDFDQYAVEYEDLLQSQLSFFAPERAYFSSYKISILRQTVSRPVGRILDFGAGVGLSIPSLQRAFPEAEICATDISEASLGLLARHHPQATVIRDDALDRERFDIIFLACVLHHVEPSERKELLARLRRLLKPAGCIAVFEHNPANPVTQRLVADCPFDEDAVLLPYRETLELVTGNAELAVIGSGYSLFFPHQLRWLRPLEPMLRWLPLGGQYYVIAA